MYCKTISGDINKNLQNVKMGSYWTTTTHKVDSFEKQKVTKILHSHKTHFFWEFFLQRRTEYNIKPIKELFWAF